MTEETITFELIRKIQREEQRTQKLSKLPDDFYKNVKSYINTKTNMENRKVVLEVKSIERLAEDIFNRRERKVLNLAIISARTNIQPENLTEEERSFFDHVLAVVKERRNTLLTVAVEKDVKGGEDEKMAPTPETAGLVVFKKEVPAFVGSDLKNYGPFKKGDITKLPDENKKIMLEQGVVDEFQIPK